MPQTPKPSKAGLSFMGHLRTTLGAEDGAPLPAICHRVLVGPAPGDPAVPFTVYLAPDRRGTFLVTCRELPALLAIGQDEDEALGMAAAAIEDALGVQRSSADFPY